MLHWTLKMSSMHASLGKNGVTVVKGPFCDHTVKYWRWNTVKL